MFKNNPRKIMNVIFIVVFILSLGLIERVAYGIQLTTTAHGDIKELKKSNIQRKNADIKQNEKRTKTVESIQNGKKRKIEELKRSKVQRKTADLRQDEKRRSIGEIKSRVKKIATRSDAGTISGKVTEADGTTPVEGISVDVYIWNEDYSYWKYSDYVLTDAEGSYSIGGLSTGTYRVGFDDYYNGKYASEYYNDKSRVDLADDVQVTAGSITTNIDASLAISGKIQGKVTEADGTTPVEGISVDVYVWNEADSYWEYFNYGFTDAEGSYAVDGLLTGTYRVGFDDYYNGKYASEYYNNKSSVDLADDVQVTAGSITTNIDASLAISGKIQGKVTEADGTTPIEGISVDVYIWNEADSYWEYSDYVLTDAEGSYTLGGLSTGTYRVGFDDYYNGKYVSEYYNNKSSVDLADNIKVTAGQITGNIDAALAVSGTIQGKVTEADGTTPVEGISVDVYIWNAADSYWEYSYYSSTNAEGNYAIGGLSTGTYRVGFDDYYNGKYVSEYYNNKSSVDLADNIKVTAGQITGNIDASLAITGSIQGKVTEADGTTPVEGILVVVYVWNAADSYWEYSDYVFTDAEGSYSINGLSTGTYRVGFDDYYNGKYVSEYYNDKSSVDLADDIQVTAGSITNNIDASLAISGKIQGKVTEADGTTPVESISVDVYIWNAAYSYWEYSDYVLTDAEGSYSIGGLSTGTYRVGFDDYYNGKYASEYYNNKSSVDLADDIQVTAGGITNNIDASLAVAGTIQGKVTEADGTTPIESISVDVYIWNAANSYWEYSDYVLTDAEGNYAIGGLLTGTYRVGFDDYYNGKYASEYYNNKSSVDLADDIQVTAGNITTNIDASLAISGKIQGKVTEADGTTPIEGVWADAYIWDESNAEWNYVSYGSTDADGNYTIGKLLTGNYRVEFYDYNGKYLREYYNNKSSVDLADDIQVTAGSITNNIDASLALAVSYIVLTDDTPETIYSGSNAQIYGCGGVNNLTIQSGANAKLINFPGNNKITIEVSYSLFKVSRSGTAVTFNNEVNGTKIIMPATKNSQQIIFDDKTLTLVINNNKVMLGNQEVTLNSSPIL